MRRSTPIALPDNFIADTITFTRSTEGQVGLTTSTETRVMTSSDRLLNADFVRSDEAAIKVDQFLLDRGGGPFVLHHGG
jgi:hypothetical protein